LRRCGFLQETVKALTHRFKGLAHEGLGFGLVLEGLIAVDLARRIKTI
jgi:hypothetical protein